VAPRDPAQAAGGAAGDRAAGSTLAEDALMPEPTTTADQIAATQALIARLEGELAAAEEAGTRAQADRRKVALSASEGDAAASRALAQARTAALQAQLEAEDVGLALAAARERLVELQAQAAHEQALTERDHALALCRERVDLAPQIDAALAELDALVGRWRQLGNELDHMSYDPDGPGRRGIAGLHLGGLFSFTVALHEAVPVRLLAALGMSGYPGNRKPLAESEPAMRALQDVGERAPAQPDPRSAPDAEQILETLNQHAATIRARTDPHQQLNPPVSERVHPPAALPGDLVVVGRTDTGGAVLQKRQYAEPRPS
jgi:hypothetical protein